MKDIPDWAKTHVRAGEHVRWWCRPSLLGIVPHGIGAGAALIPVLIWGSAYELPGLVNDALGALVPGLLIAFVALVVPVIRAFVRLRFSVYIVTDTRFIAVNSFLTTVTESLPMSRISIVTVTQGFVARYFGLWTARISSYGTAGKVLALQAIPDGETLLQEVSDGLRRGSSASWLLRGD